VPYARSLVIGRLCGIHDAMAAQGFKTGLAMNRVLVALGAVLMAAGLLWPWLKRMNLFHLPGDIVIDRPGFKFMFPITTMLILSAIISLIAWLMRR
jgi:hypothetical protein